MHWAFWREPFLYRRCLITTKSAPDNAFDAVIFERRGAWLVLKRCTLLKPGVEPIPMDGDVVIPVADFAFAQLELPS